MPGSLRPIVILMLEDDEDDYLLAMESVRDDKLLNLIYRVTNGEEGLAYLEQRAGGLADSADGAKMPFEKAPPPDIIIADLQMPKMDGPTFVRTIKADKRFRAIPVVVLTNSRDERDVSESYDIGAAAVIVKPFNVSEMSQIVKTVRDFYLSVVRLPGR